MPATRTSHPPISRSSPFPTPSPPSNRKHNSNHHQGAPSIPSGSAAESSKAAIPQSLKPNSKPKAKIRPHKPHSTMVPLPQVQEIIEISSDDDDTPPVMSSQSSIIANLRRELGKQREDYVKSKRQMDVLWKQLRAVQEDNKQLKALSANDGSKIVLDADTITEDFECAVCASEMWTPYTLPNCGHTFCQKCLIDWFGTTQAKFLAANPTYHGNQSNPSRALSQILDYLSAYPHLATDPRSITALQNSLPAEPKYECPECRSQVTSPPIEAFSLKKLIRKVAAARGQSSPRPKSKHAVARNGPWEGFFPSSKLS